MVIKPGKSFTRTTHTNCYADLMLAVHFHSAAKMMQTNAFFDTTRNEIAVQGVTNKAIAHPALRFSQILASETLHTRWTEWQEWKLYKLPDMWRHFRVLIGRTFVIYSLVYKTGCTKINFSEQICRIWNDPGIKKISLTLRKKTSPSILSSPFHTHYNPKPGL